MHQLPKMKHTTIKHKVLIGHKVFHDQHFKLKKHSIQHIFSSYMTSRAYPSDDPGSADCCETFLKCDDGLPRQTHNIQTLKSSESQQNTKHKEYQIYPICNCVSLYINCIKWLWRYSGDLSHELEHLLLFKTRS